MNAPRQLVATIVTVATLMILPSPNAFAGGGEVAPKPPAPTTSTANGGATVIVNQADGALGGAIADQANCTWTELAPYDIRFEHGDIVTFPFEPVPGSGRYMRVWNTCKNKAVLVLDASPTETADTLWAQTIAEIPVAVFELYPPLEWHATVKVPNWVYAGANVQPFTKTGGFAANRITIRVVPRAMTIDWGDKTIQTCTSLGIPYDSVTHPDLLYLQARDPGPPDACTHAYKHHSGNQPDQAYPVTMSIIWDAVWTSNSGQTGTFPAYTQTTSAKIEVDQIEVILGPAP
jgi:hypothetical protein